MEELTDFEFGVEMRILWQNSNNETREKIKEAIQGYFDIIEKDSFHIHERSDKIIFYMQSGA